MNHPETGGAPRAASIPDRAPFDRLRIARSCYRFLTALAELAQPDLTEEQATDCAYAAVVVVMGRFTPTEAAALRRQTREVPQ